MRNRWFLDWTVLNTKTYCRVTTAVRSDCYRRNGLYAVIAFDGKASACCCIHTAHRRISLQIASRAEDSSQYFHCYDNGLIAMVKFLLSKDERLN